MAFKGSKIQIVIIIVFFVAYFILAARPIPREIVLAPGWISSLETGAPVRIDINTKNEASSASGKLFPFTLGSRFGYVDNSGEFTINMVKTGEIDYGENMWTEYPAEPANIEIKNLSGETTINIPNPRGYPILLDNRVFIINGDMNALSEINGKGEVIWSYEFGSVLTCIDVAAGLVITGSLDGVIGILNDSGERIFYFQPGGSRKEVIVGCAISRDGSRAGIVCGVDQQRFLLLERLGASGGDYKVIYHEFLDTGFRRAVTVAFIDDDSRIIYEREGGLGCYNTKARRAIFVPLDGEIAAIGSSGDQGLLFLIASNPQNMELIGIKLPRDRRLGFPRSSVISDAIFIRAPFKSDDVFIGRDGNMLIVGGGSTLVSFKLEEK
jgi:hypothetical protein